MPTNNNEQFVHADAQKQTGEAMTSVSDRNKHSKTQGLDRKIHEKKQSTIEVD